MSFSCDIGNTFLKEPIDIKITYNNDEIRHDSIMKLILAFNEYEIKKQKKSCGFHLSKSKWDPYPWVRYVEKGSIADNAGLRAGDCLLDANGNNLLGLKIKDVADIIRDDKYKSFVTLYVWRYYRDNVEEENTGLALKGPLPDVATKLANAVSETVKALECPVCLESASPPVSQCVHGHILCVECRLKTTHCPVCRVRLGQGRCLLADKFHRVIKDTFITGYNEKDNCTPKSLSLRERLFGQTKKQSVHLLKSQATKPRQLLLAKLLTSGVEKAMSAENLTSIGDQIREHSIIRINSKKEIHRCFDNHLYLCDRIKSASTGELSVEGQNQVVKCNILQPNISRSAMSSSIHLERIVKGDTPSWGGSIDSILSLYLACPLSVRLNCKEIMTHATLFDHLSKSHKGPQIHFYHGFAKLSLPLPFGEESVYILHSGEEVFFLEYNAEQAWIFSTASINDSWEWNIRGWDKNYEKINIRRSTVSLEDPKISLSDHVALLPSDLQLCEIEINLSYCQLKNSFGC